MSYRIGLVGKPSVGKSTFFNAATMNDVPEGAYPFTTIDPTVGEAYVRVDCAAPEFDESCTPNVGVCREGTRFVPVKMVDVAGLVPGAHEGARTRQPVPHRPQRDRRVDPRRRLLGQNRHRGRDHRGPRSARGHRLP